MHLDPDLHPDERDTNNIKQTTSDARTSKMETPLHKRPLKGQKLWYTRVNIAIFHPKTALFTRTYRNIFERFMNNFDGLKSSKLFRNHSNIWRYIFENQAEGGVVDGFFYMELRILVRWRSKVAENDAMVWADLKNIFSKKISSKKYFFELDKVGEPSILVDFGEIPLIN